MEPIRPKEEPSTPPWVKKMVRSKYFWLALAIGIPFLVVWFKYGFFWAMGMLIVLIVIFSLMFTQHRRRPRRYYEDYDEDVPARRRLWDSPSSGETHVYHHQRHRCPRCGGTGKVDPPPINRVFGIKWQCPRCHGTGSVWD